jgi:hypothetical protein
VQGAFSFPLHGKYQLLPQHCGMALVFTGFLADLRPDWTGSAVLKKLHFTACTEYRSAGAVYG